MSDDAAMLSEWNQKRSEAAFASLVQNHANLVYGTALRVLAGDSHAAQDVTQAVFVRLAQQSSGINPGLLGAWLYRHAWFAAHKLLRQNQRRARREKEAVSMCPSAGDEHVFSKEIAQQLDKAISKLSAKDQAALVLRFLQQKDLRYVGQALGSNEDAAQKRVTRALEKLRRLLLRQGVTVSASALSTFLVGTSSAAVPSIAVTAATQAGVAASAASATTAGLFLIQAMTATQFKAVLLASTLVLALGTPLWLQHRQLDSLRQSNVELAAQLQAERARSSSLSLPAAAAPAPEASGNDADHRELLRLHGQTAALRGRIAELERKSAEKASEGNSMQNFLPIEELAFAGYADPASTLQTYFWSLKQFDTNALLKAVSPELADTYSKALTGAEPEWVRKSITSEISDLKGLKILDSHFKSPAMAVLTVQESGDKERRSLITFVKINEEWKLLDRSAR